MGVEFVRYRWYSDVDSGTVFYHSHVTFTDWYHGLIGAHIIEPAGSTYHNPVTGQPIRSGTVADIRTTGVAGNTSSGPVAARRRGQNAASAICRLLHGRQSANKPAAARSICAPRPSPRAAPTRTHLLVGDHTTPSRHSSAPTWATRS